MPDIFHRSHLIFLFIGIIKGYSSFSLCAQQARSFLRPDSTVNTAKVALVASSKTVLYGSAMLLLQHYWYKEYPRSRFHFFNDGKEWLQIDKAGHVYATYFTSHYLIELYRWAGVPHKRAIWTGGLSGWLMLSSIELLDGFSEQWGFSWWDIGFNSAGAALAIGQELAWGQQRIRLKIAAFPPHYPDGELRQRARQLYGHTVFELFLKDYNALSVWASVNIASFLHPHTRFPRWLNMALGYGAEGIYGGFENKWCRDPKVKYADCPDALKVNRTDVARYRQYYLSLDIDWSSIPVKRKGWKVFFAVFNLIKTPFPAVEFNRLDKIRLRPF